MCVSKTESLYSVHMTFLRPESDKSTVEMAAAENSRMSSLISQQVIRKTVVIISQKLHNDLCWSDFSAVHMRYEMQARNNDSDKIESTPLYKTRTMLRSVTTTELIT